MSKIEQIIAREVLDSRGNPTVEAQVQVAGGAVGAAMVPSGASTGEHEAVELRDNDLRRYNGKGVLGAVAHINEEIQAALVGQDTANQNKIDRRLIELDGTPNKSRLGANALLAVSLACARAEAAAQNLPLYLYLRQLFPKRELMLPAPQMNVINGGRHASNGLSIQEFHILPIGTANFAEAMRMGVEIYWALRALLQEMGIQTEVADEGGFAPKLNKSDEVFTVLVRAIEAAGYLPGVDAFLGVDAAASEFFVEESGMYELDGALLSAKDLAWQYRTWQEQYPLLSVEDPFDEDAWSEWIDFTNRTGRALQVVGDDLYATNPARITEGIHKKATNAVLVKPNQVGTLTETLQAILVSQEGGQQVIVSHRSGETEDTFISDLAVAVGAGQIKSGAPSRSDRVAKYNQLRRIEDATGAALAKTLQAHLQFNQPR